MKLDQLRKIIREEVRSAVKEELQDVMNEAVRAASTPGIKVASEHKQVIATPATPTKMNPQMGKSSIDEMLAMTKANMTNEEYKNVFTGTTANAQGGIPMKTNMASTMANQMGAASGRMPGIDISQLDFVKKAGAVLTAAEAKKPSLNI